jgi:hypothetical protein
MPFRDLLWKTFGIREPVSDTGNNVLQNADMSKPFGAYEYFMEQYKGIPRSRISPAIQDVLAQGIHNEISTYVNFRNREGGTFQAGDLFNDMEAMGVVMTQPFMIGQTIAKTRIGNTTLGEKYPELNRVEQVKDAANLLWQSALPGVDARIDTLVQGEHDFGAMLGGAADFVSGFTDRFFTDLIGYTPGKSGFTKFSQRGIFNESVDMTRTEVNTQARGLSQLEGMKNEPGYEMDFDSLMLRVDQSQDERFKTRHPRPGSLAYGTDIPNGTEIDLGGLTPEQITRMAEQAEAGQPVTLFDKYGDPMTFGGQPAPLPQRRSSFGYSPDRPGIIPIQPQRAGGFTPQWPLINRIMDWSFGGASGSRPNVTIPTEATMLGMGQEDNLPAREHSMSKPLNLLSSNDEATNYDIAYAASSKDLQTGDPYYGSTFSPYDPFSTDWIASRPNLRGAKRAASMFRNRGFQVDYPAVKPLQFPTSGQITRLVFWGMEPDPDVVTPAYPHDPVMSQRLLFDANHPINDEEEDNLGLEDASSSFIDELNAKEYGRISAGFRTDMTYPAAQMQVRGAQAGWVKRDKNGKVMIDPDTHKPVTIPAEELLDPETAANSKADWRALEAGGVHSDIGRRTQALKGLPAEVPVSSDSDPFGPGDNEHEETINTPKPAAPRVAKRIVSSASGPVARGSNARSINTPQPKRHSADGDFYPEETSDILGGQAAAANPPGGGNPPTPPPPPPPIDPNADPFGPGDMGGPGENNNNPTPNNPNVVNNGNPNARTPTPNRTVQAGLENHRSIGYNPSINPMMAGTREFGKAIIKDFNLWNSETGEDRLNFGLNSREMFQGYIQAEADGTGAQWIADNVPEPLRPSFINAAQKGKSGFEGAVSFNKRASPAGVEKQMEDADNPSHGPLAGYRHPHYGEMAARTITEQDGTKSTELYMEKNGEETMGPGRIGQALDVAKSSMMEASSHVLPSEPGSAAATLKANLNNLVTQHVEEIAKQMRAAGADPDTVQKATGFIHDAALQVTNHWAKSLGIDISGGNLPGEPSSRQEGDTRYDAKKPKDLADAKQILEDHPRIKTQVEEYMQRNGISLEGMMDASAGHEAIFTDEGMSFQFGGNGRGRGADPSSTRGRGGLWRGNIGTAMYAAYVGTRMWSMGMGEELQTATKYGDYASGIGNIVGGGLGTLGSASGFAARQSMGQLYEGRGAYQEFGSFMDIPFYMSAGGSDSASRMLASGKAGATMAAEVSIGGSLLAGLPGVVGAEAGTFGAAMGGLAGALPVMGLGLGLTIAGGTGAMEVYNSAHPDQDAVTWSSLFKSVVTGDWRNEATKKYYADHPEADPDNILRGATKETRFDPATNAVSTALSTAWAGIRNSVASIPGLGGLAARVGTVDDADLKKYMTPAQIGETMPIKNADVEAAIKASEAFMPYGMDATQAQKMTQTLFATSGIVPTTDLVTEFGPNVQRYGASAITDPGQYAHDMGFTPGTDAYLTQMRQFNQITDITERNNWMQSSSRNAQIASQVSPYMVPTQWGTANEVAAQYGINTQPMASSWQRFNQTISNYQVGALNEMQIRTTANMAVGSTPLQAQYISQMGEMAGTAGRDVLGAMDIAQTANLTPTQWNAVSSVMGGDLQGASYFANKGLLSSKHLLYDQSGNPISETNGAMAMWVSSQNGASWAQGTSDTMEMASRFTGNHGDDVTQAFWNKGMRGVQDLSIQSGIDYRHASNALQMQGFAAQQSYMSSSWGLQDTQIAQNYGFQQADFDYSQKSMDVSLKYALMGEANQQQRMNTSQTYNLWQMDFSHMQAVQQRGWTQADYQYQDTQRSENFEWQMTDLNEDIRFAGGRQRRQLIRQRDRAALQHGQEEEQIDTTRDRQAQLWAQEDERYAKQRAYTLELNALDKSSFETSRQQRIEMYALENDNLARKRKEFDESQALEKQIRDNDRQKQTDDLTRQIQAAVLQQKQADDQDRYAAATREADRNWTDLLGKIQNSAKYDAVNKFSDAMQAIVGVINSADTNKINQLVFLIQQLN